MRENPCKQTCPYRTPDCHCTCKDYKDFVADKQKDFETRRLERISTSYAIEAQLKRKKRRHIK